MLWWLGLAVETVVCLGIRAVQRNLERGAGRGATSLARRVRDAGLGDLARRGRARQLTHPALPLERQELRRRTGWLTFGLMTAAMAPMLAVVLIAAPGLNPVLGELVAWGVLCASPALTSAPASLVASVVALGRGWVTPDDGGGGGRFDGVPLGSTPPDSHEYTLAG